jgi:epoxyqueuosine reductase
VAPIDGLPLTLAAWLKDEARAIGFDLAGITTPDPPPHLDVYAAWLEEGRQGDMRYLATERARAARADPRLLLPEVRSVLVLAANYAPPPPATHPQAQIAAYARGDDYHAVLGPRADALVARLQHRLGRTVAARVYTDSGPLLERELAQRAGLGWIGRNTCLIHPRLGSMVLLVEVLLGLELPADTPFAADRCGTCQRCVQACPTGCILPDRTLDARRCVSYLTIEARGPITPALRPAVGDRLFGCDVCQQVCPWNLRFGHPTSDPTFAPRPGLDPAAPAAFLALAASGFSAWLRGSPLKRAKRVGLARNAAVVAGNSRRSENVPALGNALLKDEAPLVRQHAAWALGEIGGPPAQSLLSWAAVQEADREVRTEIEAALRRA